MQKNSRDKRLYFLELLDRLSKEIVSISNRINHRWGVVFRSRTFFMITSLVISLVIWLFVAFNGETEAAKTITANVKYVNMPKEYSIYAPVREVEMRVTGRASRISGLSENDIAAIVDLANLSAGEYSLPIRLLHPPFVRVMDSTPTDAKVELFRNVERTFEIQPVIIGEMPEGKIVSSVSFSPSECTVSGREADVLSIDGVYADVPIGSLKDGNKVRVKIKMNMLNGKNGNYERDMLTLSPKETIAAVTFENETIGERIPVKVSVVGKPADGFQIETIKIVPESVSVKGSSKAVRKMQSLVLPPVDITGLEDDIQIMLPLKPQNLEEGVEISGPERASVEIHLSKKIITKTISSVPIVIVGKEHGKEWHITPKEVSVIVEGPQKAVETLTNLSLPCELYVDVSNIVSTQVELPVLVRNLKKEIQIVNTEPEHVSVTLINK
ncbi:MAG: CdaR family protein [Synergistes sp.]|nr:CdaR family protein [Synergistes sp.]